ncbi:DeoR family transcriptional regulator, partial [Sinorhizobium meliloti]
IDGASTLVLEADAPEAEVAAFTARGANVVLAKEPIR